ncbi:unnamed protein product [Lactuca saligna]|uniref:PPM-type phosphatase domain-containing protein n=1 Tax=Lactuca saligna TaxID=75948 RepID=A0AA35UVQ7_LACSI|nr:unnamed protein product [Lactuca saligna]
MFTPQTFLDAFSQIEDEFVQLVRTTNEGDHSMFEVGTSCLVCMLWGDDLFVCNLGDSRAVIGRKVKLGRFKRKAITIPLTNEDNVNIENVRQEIQHQNPNEEDIVIPDGNGVWRIRGLSEVSGSIGDLYLKFPEFATDRLEGRPINKALLKSIPTVKRLHIEEDDMFVIMGSRGFWDHISSDKAVEIVHNNSHSGIAKILIGEALNVAANKLAEKITSTAMVGENEGSLPMYDDISVVVIFIDQRLFHRRGNTKEFVSLKAYEEIQESEYNKTYRVEWKAPNPGIIVATSPPSTGVATSFRGAASGSGGGVFPNKTKAEIPICCVASTHEGRHPGVESVCSHVLFDWITQRSLTPPSPSPDTTLFAAVSFPANKVLLGYRVSVTIARGMDICSIYNNRRFNEVANMHVQHVLDKRARGNARVMLCKVEISGIKFTIPRSAGP